MPWGAGIILTLALASGPFQWYVLRRTIVALEAVTAWPRKTIRLTVAMPVVWAAVYPILFIGSYVFGIVRVARALQSAETPLDALVVYPFWIWLAISVQLAICLLVIDGVRLILFPLHKKHQLRSLKVQSRVVILVVCLVSIYALARVYLDTFTVRTRQIEFPVAGLPSELDGFRIVQISDMHTDPRTNDRKLQLFVDGVNNLKPDLVLFCGDLVSSGTAFIEKGAAVMGKMEAHHGVYACLGDHDHFSDKEMVTQSLLKNGVTVLDNVATVVPVGSTYLSLTGITNVYRSRPSAEILDTIEQQRLHGPVKILLTHQPSPWLVNFAADKGYNLFVAGHTHGGQVAFPLPWFLLTGSSFETSYVSGFYGVGSMLVSINNGLGLTLGPIRYQAPAEVTLIVLRPQAGDSKL
ncbi:MAG TPA: metallophosphoesterase [Blastocatellia bacterium]|nr:metallophosphoesterase [Blastocatellia bacterium]